jgi:hypothetical protein
MNTTRTLLCLVLLLLAGRLVWADATVIEGFRVSWARADGDTLIMGGGAKEGKHGAVCMADAKGTITRLRREPSPPIRGPRKRLTLCIQSDKMLLLVRLGSPARAPSRPPSALAG